MRVSNKQHNGLVVHVPIAAAEHGDTLLGYSLGLGARRRRGGGERKNLNYYAVGPVVRNT